MSAFPNSIPASPKKLRNGQWGAWADSEAVKVGDTLYISTKSGKSWNARITKVIWRGKGGAICETLSMTHAQPTSRQSYRPQRAYASSCGYPCPVTRQRCTPSNPCHDCQ